MVEKMKITGFVEIEIASCIDHTTTDVFDLSAEELRFLCRHYQPSYDAVSVLLPPLLHPKVVATTAHGGSLPPPSSPAIKFLKPSQSPNLVLEDAYGGLDVHHHDDVIDVDNDGNDVHDVDGEDEFIEVIDLIDLDDDDDDSRREYSIVASSVGSNDSVSDAMDDDAVSSSQYV